MVVLARDKGYAASPSMNAVDVQQLKHGEANLGVRTL